MCVDIQGYERVDVLANDGSISGTLFQNQARLTNVNTSDIHTHAKTRLLTEWQERWNDCEMGRYCFKGFSIFLFFCSIFFEFCSIVQYLQYLVEIFTYL
jgi:hypothetical protein